jgi:hypothetical protein
MASKKLSNIFVQQMSQYFQVVHTHKVQACPSYLMCVLQGVQGAWCSGSVVFPMAVVTKLVDLIEDLVSVPDLGACADRPTSANANATQA